MLAYPKSHLGKPQESTRHGDSDTKLTGHGVDTNDDQAQVDHPDQDFLASLARQPTDQSVDPSDHGRIGSDNQDHFEQCHLDSYGRVRQSDRTILNGSEFSPLSFTVGPWHTGYKSFLLSAELFVGTVLACAVKCMLVLWV